MQILSIYWDIDPVIFQIGSFGVRYYSLMFAFAFATGYFITKKIYKKENINTTELDSLLYYVVFGALIGARLGHCLFYDFEYYLSSFGRFVEIFIPVSFTPSFHFTGYQGLASHGGAIGVIVAILLFRKKSEKKSILWILDRITVPTGFACAFIRLGNLFNSEIYGHQTDLPWGFIFANNGDTLASHPTQLYEALIYFISSCIMLLLYKNIKIRNSRGFLLGFFIIFNFSGRFIIEFFKNIQIGFESNMLLNMGQWLSVPFILTGIIIMFLSWKGKLDKF